MAEQNKDLGKGLVVLFSKSEYTGHLFYITKINMVSFVSVN